LENPLSKLILEGKFPPKSTVHVACDPVRSPGVLSFSA
jgi:ATP-dependent Clp protease ATP-binding subunit ClpB